MSSADLAPILAELIGRMPEWVRHDLSSKDQGARHRAEETLTAIIVAAISKSSGLDQVA